MLCGRRDRDGRQGLFAHVHADRLPTTIEEMARDAAEMKQREADRLLRSEEMEQAALIFENIRLDVANVLEAAADFGWPVRQDERRALLEMVCSDMGVELPGSVIDGASRNLDVMQVRCEVARLRCQCGWDETATCRAFDRDRQQQKG